MAECNKGITFCETCGGCVMPGYVHTCPPLWDVMCPDSHDDEVVKVRGVSAEDAAEEFAKAQDDEPPFNEPMRILVKVDCATWKTFDVTAEPDVHYSVRSVE